MALITNDTQTQQTLFAAGIAQQVGQEAKRREQLFNALMHAAWASGAPRSTCLNRKSPRT